MTSSSDNFHIEIRLAKSEDEAFIEKAFNEHFLEDEALNIYMKDYRPLEGIHQTVPNYGLTLIAEVISNGQRDYAGFLLNSIHKPDDSHLPEDYILRTDNPVGYEIYRLHSELFSKYNVFEEYQVDEYFELAILSVDPNYRGMSIGRKLCEEGLKLAKSKGYRVACIDCTGHFSAEIARKLQMEYMGAISYEDHRNENGERMFTTYPPHTHFRRFIQVFDEDEM